MVREQQLIRDGEALFARVNGYDFAEAGDELKIEGQRPGLIPPWGNAPRNSCPKDKAL
jgi:hypothetical protein